MSCLSRPDTHSPPDLTGREFLSPGGELTPRNGRQASPHLRFDDSYAESTPPKILTNADGCPIWGLGPLFNNSAIRDTKSGPQIWVGTLFNNSAIRDTKSGGLRTPRPLFNNSAIRDTKFLSESAETGGGTGGARPTGRISLRIYRLLFKIPPGAAI